MNVRELKEAIKDYYDDQQVMAHDGNFRMFIPKSIRADNFSEDESGTVWIRVVDF